jgi:tetratricopeptide (TPR) repeat protein
MGISLCMIVKNEQDWIAGAVESVRSIVSEVIIVDTGSTDSTMPRAQALGAKVLQAPWTQSFAAARNVSLAAAAEPWILVLDADERIAPRDLPLIKDAARTGSADGYHLIQRNYVFNSRVLDWTPNSSDYSEGSGYPGYVDNPLIRLFRNSPEMQFRGAVHEIIDPNHLPGHLRFSSIPAVIHHYGKVRNEQHVQAKQQLYLELGRKKITEDPENAKAHLDLGIQYQELGSHAEATACFQKAFGIKRQAPALLYWAISEKHLQHYETAASLLSSALELGLDTFEVHLELGNIYQAQKQFEAARDEYGKCRALRPDNPIAVFNYGLVLRKTSDLDGARNCYQKALSLDPEFREPMLELAVLYLQSKQPDEALHVLQPAPNVDAVVQSLRGAAYLQKNNLGEAQQCLEAALKKDRSLADVRLNLAQVYARQGDHARAARYVQSVNIR